MAIFGWENQQERGGTSAMISEIPIKRRFEWENQG